MKVHIPTPLLSYTNQQGEVDAEGATLEQLLADLDNRYPGLRFRMVDEQSRLRPHMKIFVNRAVERDLALRLEPSDEVTIMQALSGG